MNFIINVYLLKVSRIDVTKEKVLAVVRYRYFIFLFTFIKVINNNISLAILIQKSLVVIFLSFYFYVSAQPKNPIPFYYDFAQTNITAQQLKILDSIFQNKNVNQNKIVIISYADSVGSIQSNIAITIKRGNNLKNIICEKYAIDSAAITVIPKGKLFPTYDNKSEDRSKNRRSDLHISLLPTNEMDSIFVIENSDNKEDTTLVIPIKKCNTTEDLDDTMISIKGGYIFKTKTCIYNTIRPLIFADVHTTFEVNKQGDILFPLGKFCINKFYSENIKDTEHITLLIPATKLIQDKSLLIKNNLPYNVMYSSIKKDDTTEILVAILLKPILMGNIWYYELTSTKEAFENIKCAPFICCGTHHTILKIVPRWKQIKNISIKELIYDEELKPILLSEKKNRNIYFHYLECFFPIADITIKLNDSTVIHKLYNMYGKRKNIKPKRGKRDYIKFHHLPKNYKFLSDKNDKLVRKIIFRKRDILKIETTSALEELIKRQLFQK